MNSDSHLATLKHIGDAVSALLAIGTIAKVLPPVAALATLIWTGMRIYEGLTGTPFHQSGLAKWITRRNG